MNMKVLVAALFGAAMVVDAGASRAAPWEDILAKLYPAAKAEGEVVVNSERIEEVGGKDGIAAFTKRFPGIKVTMNGTAGSRLPTVIIAESQAGKSSIDTFRSDPDRADPLAQRGLLLKVAPSELTDQPVKTYFDGHFFKLSDHISNFVVNTELVKAADRPKRFEDLLDPKWKGKLALDARGGQIAHLLSTKVWDEKKFWDFVAGLKKQDPIWTSRNTEAMAKITSGEGAVGTGSYAAVGELREQGAPVEFLFLSPALSQVRGMAIVKAAAHPNAAKLFVGWLMSPEGLDARDKNDVGIIAPGTRLYDKIKATGAEITFEDDIEQILARDKVSEKITAEWGVLK
jgi:iron(III) transport system substrate-binding protein